MTKPLSEHLPSDFKPDYGMIMGSGLSEIFDVEVVGSVSYTDITGFHVGNVEGHLGQCIWGYIHKVPVIILQGRAHLYQGATHENIKAMLRSLKDAGCHSVVITNAAGSMNPDVKPGDVMMIHDHLNLMGITPLLGPNDDNYGPRFVGMEGAYDPAYRKQVLAVAKAEGITCPEGVYCGVLGPHYETPAEIKAMRILGGDLVGMSTVAEVIVARHCGLKVLALSAVSNQAAGMDVVPVDHSRVLEFADKAANKLKTLIAGFLKQAS